MNRVRSYVVVAIIAASPIVFADNFKSPDALAQRGLAQRGLAQGEKFRTRTGAVRGRYIVRLDDRVAGKPGRFSRAENVAAAVASSFRVPRVISVQKHAINGFVAEMPEGLARALSRDPRVLYVEAVVTGSLREVQSDPEPSLDLIDGATHAAQDGLYHYDLDGTGVTAYVIDSGIRATHQEFGGRVTNGGNFSNPPGPEGCLEPPEECEEGELCDNPGGGDDDPGGGGGGGGGFAGDGYSGSHGTQVGALLGGERHGVAKNVDIVSLQITNECRELDSGGATDAIDWVVGHYYGAGGPAVLNLSWGLDDSTDTLYDAIVGALSAGITVVGAAGNGSKDAAVGGLSPNVVPGVMLVGASTVLDTKYDRSNTGALIDLFAPGENIVSACTDSDTCYTSGTSSGTSFSAPYVAGVAAMFLQANPWAPPAHVESMLVDNAKDVLIGNLGAGSPNKRLYSGFLLGLPPPPPGPDIVSVSPSSGPTFGGTGVTITGTGFVGVSSVTVGGASLTGLSIDSSTTITGLTPIRSVGPANVVVTTTAGSDTLVNGFVYTSGPDPGVPDGAMGGGEFPTDPLVALQTSEFAVLRAVSGGGGDVDAGAISVGNNETFLIDDANDGDLTDGDEIRLVANSGHYLQASGGGGSGLTAVGGGPGSWETFTIVNVSRPGFEILPGDEVALRSVGGYYVVAENGGGGAVNANRLGLGVWETFRIWHGLGAMPSGGGPPPPPPPPPPGPTLYNLSISAGGTGSGTVVSNGPPVDCSNNCNYEVEAGTQLILYGDPDLGSSWTSPEGWSGCDWINGTGWCYVTMSGNRTVTATFAVAVGPNLIENGDFEGGVNGAATAPNHWFSYGLPTPVDVQWSLPASPSGGSELAFYRLAGSAQGVIGQATQEALAVFSPMHARFRLGNADSVRKRISVILHDNDWSDSIVCNFWLDPSQPLAQYEMKGTTREAWANATLSFYASTPNGSASAAGYRLDDVELRENPALPAARTDCVDPMRGAPAGATSGNLIANGTFDSVLAPWGTWGSLTWQVVSGVMEFFQPTPAPGTPSGVVTQATGQAVVEGQRISAWFSLGNSSSQTQRVNVFLHDSDFSDHAICTVWLPAGQPLKSYRMQMYATEAWTNAQFSIYPSMSGSSSLQWLRLDDVAVQKTLGDNSGIECVGPY